MLPLKTSINAIYRRLINKINYPVDKCGLLYSDKLSELLNIHDEIDFDLVEQTRQLSLPLTVSTLDQLMDFVLKYEGYEVKLATLSYSKIVIDEIQMYSSVLVAILIMALKYISNCGGKFAILTATLPPVFEYFLKKELGENTFI